MVIAHVSVGTEGREFGIPMQVGWLDSRETGMTGPHCWSVRDRAQVQLLGRWRCDNDIAPDDPLAYGTIAGQRIKEGVLGEIVTWTVDMNGFGPNRRPALLQLPKSIGWLNHAAIGDMLWLIPEGHFVQVLDRLHFEKGAGSGSLRGQAYDGETLATQPLGDFWFVDQNGQSGNGVQLFYPFLERETHKPTIPAVETPDPANTFNIAGRLTMLEENVSKITEILQTLIQPSKRPMPKEALRPGDPADYEIVVKFSRNMAADKARLVMYNRYAFPEGEDKLPEQLRELFRCDLQETYAYPETPMRGIFEIVSVTLPVQTLKD